MLVVSVIAALVMSLVALYIAAQAHDHAMEAERNSKGARDAVDYLVSPSAPKTFPEANREPRAKPTKRPLTRKRH